MTLPGFYWETVKNCGSGELGESKLRLVKKSVSLDAMKPVALTAHFDGEKVQFDEPCQIDANARLVVVVLPPDDERHAWSRFSAGQLAKAYGENEPEYTATDLRP